MTLAISVFAAVIGAAGFTLSVLNYLRDRSMIQVHLQWDLTVSDEGLLDPAKLWGVIRVTNTGRRPVYITIAAFGHWRGKSPMIKKNRDKDSFLIIAAQSVGGVKLGEGDPPSTFVVDQAKLGQYADRWIGVRAYVEDSTGRSYVSEPVKERPSWAKPTGGGGCQ